MIVVAQCQLEMTENCLLVTRSHHCLGITIHIKRERRLGIVLGNNEKDQHHGIDENKNVLD